MNGAMNQIIFTFCRYWSHVVSLYLITEIWIIKGWNQFYHINFRLANKQDVKGALDEIDVCEKLRIEDMVNMYKIPCKVVSKS